MIGGVCQGRLSSKLCSMVGYSFILCECVCVCVCVCVSVVSDIVKCPVLPPCVVDGRSTNPLYYYYLEVKVGAMFVNA